MMETETCLWCLRDCPINEFCTCEGGRRRMERTARGNLPRVGIRPPWKSVGDGYEVQSFPDGSNRVRYVGQTKPFATTPPQPSPLDRALEDFTARRRAKREEAPDDVWQRFDAYQKEDRRQLDLARALSTPLPHDPDIHTRLMPWRGK